MRWLRHRLLGELVRLLERCSPGALERRLDAELRDHVDRLARDLERAGQPREAARRIAAERLGDRERHRAASLSAMGVVAARRPRLGDRTMRVFVTETRLAARSLLRSPGYTATVIVTLALGVGANAAIFGVLDAVLLRPLPYHEPARLVRVWGTSGTDVRSNANPIDLADWRRETRLLDGLLAIHDGSATWVGVDRPEQIAVHGATHDWLEVLGVTPELGRGFTAEEAAPGGDAVALLEHAFWSRELGGDPQVVGRTLMLAGVEHTIVGVLPAGFPHPLGWRSPSLWRPLVIDFENTSRGGHFLHAAGRLAPGATLEAAQAELDVVTAALALEHPSTNTGVGARLEPLRDAVVGDAARTLWVLLAAVGLLLLVAALDVGALALARELERRRETAVRAALGASRFALLRGLLLEGGLLAFAGAALGLALATTALAPLLRFGVQRLPWSEHARFDFRIAVFTAAVALVAGFLLALPAALRGTAGSALAALGVRAKLAGASRLDARSALVISQVALSLVLLSVAALVTHGLRQILSIDPGFDSQRALTARVTVPRDGYDADSRLAFFRSLEERLAASGAVDAVGLVNRLPFAGGYSCDGFTLADREAPPPGQEECVEERVVTPGYFAALGLGLLQGRGFSETDRADTPPVVVVNDAMARRYWPGASPLGRRFRWGNSESTGPWREIVGVVEDVRHFGLVEEPQPEVYLPHAQVTYPSSFHVVMSGDAPDAALADLRAALRELDPRVPAFDVSTMRERIAGSIETERARSGLLLLFAGSALALTLLGLWGSIAFATARRRREIGLRVALGATRGEVLGLVASQGLRLVVAGFVLGLAGSLVARQLVRGLLHDAGSGDLSSLLAASLALLAGAAIAVLGPSSRALRVEPATALRDE